MPTFLFCFGLGHCYAGNWRLGATALIGFWLVWIVSVSSGLVGFGALAWLGLAVVTPVHAYQIAWRSRLKQC